MPTKKARRRVSFRDNKLNGVFLIIAFLCLGFAVVRAQDWYSHTQGTALPPIVGRTVSSSTPTPDEKPVPTDADYPVSADQPRKITIGSLGTKGFIQGVGKDQKGDIAVPSNVSYAGWYVSSVKPGDKGLSIIDGHVSSRYGSAIFAKLADLQKNETLQVEFGDGSQRTFRVVEKRELPETETADFLFQKKDDINSQLNLITCGGSFNKRSRAYSNRVVVVTERIN